MKFSGIYQIINMINDKSYIGSSKNIYKRWLRHKQDLNNNSHHSIYLQRAWNKYGSANFKMKVLEKTTNLLIQEKYWFVKLQPEYSIGSIGGGDNLTNNPRRKQIIANMTTTMKNLCKNESIEQRQDRRDRQTGPKNSNWKGGKTFFKCPKCKKTIRIAGTKYKPKTCAKCRDRTKSKNPFYGHTHSLKTKKLIQQKRLGTTPSNTKGITIDGITYKSYTDAAKALKVSVGTISYKVKKGHYKTKQQP